MKLSIGRRVDSASMVAGAEPVQLDAAGLTRHAVCIGMTGSGKTGLCVALLEEVASAGVPTLIIDPKGDLGNLALAFREQRAEDFLPWVDADAARREGVTPEVLAQRTADRWRSELAKWEVGPERVARFTDSVKVSLYTPGATHGQSIDLLGSLFSPPADASDEARQELVQGAVSSLLGLLGQNADPLTDPAHLLLSRVFDDAWSTGDTLDFETLITRLVDPPYAKIGVFPVETFFPRTDRMKLALQLNGLAAAPSFAAWTQGEALDPDRWLRPEADGRTPVRIFSLAHLDDAGRMFFIGQLLDRLVAWSRRQPGTSSLRGFLYFDEVYGYLPPHPRNPPTKRPMLTLMKQARAVGLGTMLVTQNPVDLDYAAIANAGLWMVGRLQTAQDREKVVQGLVGAAGGDPAAIDRAIARLPSRTFVVREAGAPEAILVHSRQTISFLRGPLNTAEIARLRGSAVGAPAVPRVAKSEERGEFLANPPPSPSGYPYRYLDPAAVFSARHQVWSAAHARPARSDGRVVYEPALYARLELQFDEGKEFVHRRDEHRLFFPIGNLDTFVEPSFEAAELSDVPVSPAWFAPLPSTVDESKELKALEKRVVDDVLRGETERSFVHRALKLEGRAGETQEAFAARVQAAIDDRIDADLAKIQERVQKDVKRLEDRKERLLRDRDRHADAARAKQVSEAVSIGETLLGLFFGRKKVTTGLSSAVSKRAATSAAQGRVEAADAELASIEADLEETQRKLADEVEAIRARHGALIAEIEAIDVRLERADLRLAEFGIVWVPVTRGL